MILKFNLKSLAKIKKVITNEKENVKLMNGEM
jgi:hypothetical protein